MKQFQVQTFKTNKKGDEKMAEWLNELQEKHIVEDIWTTLIAEDEIREVTKKKKLGQDEKVDEKMRTSKVQVIVKLKRM